MCTHNQHSYSARQRSRLVAPVVSVLVPQKPIGGTLAKQLPPRIVTKIGGDRETGCISKDQPAIVMQIIILEDIPDSVSLPGLK